MANALNGANCPARDLVIPHCTYTDPEAATVGLTPVRAAEQGIALETHRLDLAKVERAFIDNEEEGFAALDTRKSSPEIVGAILVAARCRCLWRRRSLSLLCQSDCSCSSSMSVLETKWVVRHRTTSRASEDFPRYSRGRDPSLKERIVRELGYGVSLEGASDAALVKLTLSYQARSEDTCHE